MDTSGISSAKHLRLAVLTILVACVACGDRSHQAQTKSGSAGASVPGPPVAPLSSDDVSILFPAPTRTEDFAKLIAVADLTAQNPQDPSKHDPVWPDAAFQQFLAIAASPSILRGISFLTSRLQSRTIRHKAIVCRGSCPMLTPSVPS